MGLVEARTEQATAATDFALGVVALVATVQMWRLRNHGSWKATLWAAAFACLSLASFLGAVAHGVVMSRATNALVWHPLNLALSLVVALFVAGATYDRWGVAAGRRALQVMIVVAIAFFVLRVAAPSSFLVFIVFEAAAMLFALVAYAQVAWQRPASGAPWMVAGVLVTIAAAAVQASTTSLALIWQFDHNGLYHVVQMVGVVLLLTGIRRSLVPGIAHPALRGVSSLSSSSNTSSG